MERLVRALSSEWLRQPTRSHYEDVLAAPPNKVAEIVDGELFVRPTASPTPGRQRHSRGTGSAFKRGRGGPGGWVIVYEPELHSRATCSFPIWQAGGVADALAPNAPFFTLAPDWNLRSSLPRFCPPGSQGQDAHLRTRGRPNAWLVDPSSAPWKCTVLSPSAGRCWPPSPTRSASGPSPLTLLSWTWEFSGPTLSVHPAARVVGVYTS